MIFNENILASKPKVQVKGEFRPIRETGAGSSNSPQITSSKRLLILPAGLALIGEISLGNQRPNFIKEKVEHG